MKITDSSIEQLINQIYDAALDSTQWGTTIQLLANKIGAEQGVIRTVNRSTKGINQVYKFNKDSSWDKPYKDYYCKTDPWLKLFIDGSGSKHTCTHYLVSDKDYQKTEHYNDFVAPQNFHYGIGSFLEMNSNLSAYVALQRKKTKNGFEDSSLNTLKVLGSHIAKALMINEKTHQVDFEKQLLIDALNQINTALLLVSKTNEILFINKRAETLVESSEMLQIRFNRLQHLDIGKNKQLKHLVYSATCTDESNVKKGGALRIQNTLDKTDVYCLISPINQDMVNQYNASSDCAIIFLSTKEPQAKLSSTTLKQLYGFTTAEAHLARALCQGLTLAEVAKKENLSKNTLRTQLKACFHKTGVNRQASLISLINHT